MESPTYSGGLGRGVALTRRWINLRKTLKGAEGNGTGPHSSYKSVPRVESHEHQQKEECVRVLRTVNEPFLYLLDLPENYYL